jgi:predicted Rossmann-fold nucleotide-binding protein
VTVFGSARFTEENPYYQLARETSELIAKAGFTVMIRRVAGCLCDGGAAQGS